MNNAFNNVTRMLNVNLLQTKPNSEENIFFEFNPDMQWLKSTPYKFNGVGVFRGKAECCNSTVIIKGQIEIPTEFVCSLCGERFNENLFIEVDEVVVEDNDDFEHFKIQQNKIDLNIILNELVVLNIPSQVFCKPDCLGVCQICGKNLNEGECGCKHD